MYASDGGPANVDFSIRHPRQPANDWFKTTIESLHGDSEVTVPPFGPDDDWIVQHFRQISVRQALKHLPV